MTDLFVVGNGFDLYHGLPTRYTDFLSFVRSWNIFWENYKNIESGEEELQFAVRLSEYGSYVSREENYYEQFELSRIYENLIARIVLKLLGYTGKYVDRGTIGFPERNIAVPIGGDE